MARNTLSRINPWTIEPLRNFDEIFRPFNRLVDFDEEYKALSVDMWEEDNKYIVEASVPGIKPEELDISVEDRYLTISGQTKSEKEDEDKKKKYHMRERTVTSFTRTVMLPGDVDVETVEAKCENGMVKIELPKTQKSVSKKIEVK